MGSASCALMLKRLVFLGCGLWGAAAVCAQPAPSALEVANLREDVRGLVQRVGDLSLRVEQLERENRELRGAASNAAAVSYATTEQLASAVAELNRTIRAAAADTKSETLQQVAVQMEKLARQTNAALDSISKGAAAQAPVTFSDNYAKEGTSYTVVRGDTLAGIAKKTGAKAQDIINANKITDPSRIQVGQTLFIPGGK